MDADTTYVASITPATTENWVFYHIYMDKLIVKVEIGSVPPEINSEWLVAAVLDDSEKLYNMITVRRTETLQCWGLGSEDHSINN